MKSAAVTRSVGIEYQLSDNAAVDSFPPLCRCCRAREEEEGREGGGGVICPVLGVLVSSAAADDGEAATMMNNGGGELQSCGEALEGLSGFAKSAN